MVQWTCTNCGRTLQAEGFTGPRSWFSTEGVALSPRNTRTASIVLPTVAFV